MRNPWLAAVVFCALATSAGTILAYTTGEATFWYVLAALGVLVSIAYARLRGVSLGTCAACGLMAVGATFAFTIATMLVWVTATAVVDVILD